MFDRTLDSIQEKQNYNIMQLLKWLFVCTLENQYKKKVSILMRLLKFSFDRTLGSMQAKQHYHFNGDLLSCFLIELDIQYNKNRMSSLMRLFKLPFD